MEIQSTRYIAGPNIYHNRPVLVMQLALGDRVETSSAQLEGFTARLTSLLPGLIEHTCSPGYRGGFIERLERGTYFAHIVEHVALELSGLAGIGVGYGKSRHSGTEGVYTIVIRCKSEKGMTAVLRTAVEMVDAVADGAAFDLVTRVSELQRLVRAVELGPSSQAILTAVKRRNIPWRRLNDQSLVQLGHGVHRTFLQTAVTGHTSSIAMDIASDKNMTKRMLEDAEIPTPRGWLITREDELARFFPSSEGLVVKPLNANHGRGVTTGVYSLEGAVAAFHFARQHAKSVIVEQLFIGNDYRVLVVGGKMVAAAERTPAHVVGDGVASIAQLVARENENPRRGTGHSSPMTRLELGAPTMIYLEKQGLTADSVPPENEKVFLAATANLSSGGSAKDVTDCVHPDVRDTCERAARAIGLDICGIDLLTPDISEPLPKTGAGIIEVNAGPGLRMHSSPSEGIARDIGQAIVEELFPGESNGRIPIVAVTGTNGKTTVTRLIAHIASLTGKCVGTTDSERMSLAGHIVARGDLSGPRSAATVLADPRIEIAVLETARGGIVRSGLGFDWCDVGVLTNIQPDHLGQSGIETLEELAKVKGVVAERVRDGGTLVLNARDERLRALAKSKHAKGKHVVFFSLEESESVPDGTFVIRSGEDLVVRRNGCDERVCAVREVPITLGGRASFQIENCLTAIAACLGLGISMEMIADGLRTFFAAAHNPGRSNIYRVGQGFVVVDFAHNPEALRAVTQMLGAWRPRKITGVVALPGDRNHAILVQSARIIAEGFDKVLIREDRDLRGRAPGEVAGLLEAEIAKQPSAPPVRVVSQEKEALATAIREMTDGEIVAVFFDRNDAAVREVILAHAGEPVGALPVAGA